MSGRGYTVFDTAVGRCGIAWGELGVLGVQLPEAREIETRRRLFQLFPDARELRPPPDIQSAIDGIAALLRGKAADFSEVRLDMTGIPAVQRAGLRLHPDHPARRDADLWRGRRAGSRPPAPRIRWRRRLSRNPFMMIVPCHRVLEAGGYADRISPNGGSISKRRLLSIEGAGSPGSKTLFDVLLPVAPPRPQG